MKVHNAQIDQNNNNIAKFVVNKAKSRIKSGK